ncbi:MAG: ATP-binding cassette domain-containing protein, partial [Clostridia bacterium]
MKHTESRNVCGACCTKVSGLQVTLEGTCVLRDIALHVHCGELTAIIGPNGAGKTTLFKALLGQIPYQGTIAFCDAKDGGARTPRIGYVPQYLELDRMAPVSVLDFFIACTARRPAFFPPTSSQRVKIRAALARTGAEMLLDRRM